MKKTFQIKVSKDLPWFQGHFPGQPILPGFVLVQWGLDWIRSETQGRENASYEVIQAKFLDVIQPDDELNVEVDQEDETYSMTWKSDRSKQKFNAFIKMRLLPALSE